MSKTKGIVTRIGDGKFSKYIMIDTKDGFYFNTKYNPKCGVGDTVGIEFESKGDTRGNVKKVVILNDAGGPKGVQESSGGGSGGAGGQAGGARQDSIVFQSSRKDALVFVGLLVSTESIKLPKAADREEFLGNLVDSVTAHYFAAASDPKKSGVLAASEEIPEDNAKDNFDGEDKKEDEWGGDDEWNS